MYKVFERILWEKNYQSNKANSLEAQLGENVKKTFSLLDGNFSFDFSKFYKNFIRKVLFDSFMAKAARIFCTGLYLAFSGLRHYELKNTNFPNFLTKSAEFFFFCNQYYILFYQY